MMGKRAESTQNTCATACVVSPKPNTIKIHSTVNRCDRQAQETSSKSAPLCTLQREHANKGEDL